MPGMYQYLLKSGQTKSCSNHVPNDALGESRELTGQFENGNELEEGSEEKAAGRGVLSFIILCVDLVTH